MSNIYIERLFFLADHIAGMADPIERPTALIIMTDSSGNRVQVKTLIWIFYELPGIFPDDWFEDCNTNRPIIGGFDDSGIGTIQSVFYFFGLTAIEIFTALFAVNNTIDEKSSSRQVSENIINYITNSVP